MSPFAMPNGKPSPVGALVVGEHPFADVAEPRVREDARADLGVPAHLGPLLVAQRLGLGEQHVRDRDLADVVQHAGEPDALDHVAAGRPSSRAISSAVPADGLRMPRGARVAHVERLGERQHGREMLVARAAAAVDRRQDARDLAAVDDRAVAAQLLGGVERVVGRAQQRLVDSPWAGKLATPKLIVSGTASSANASRSAVRRRSASM